MRGRPLSGCVFTTAWCTLVLAGGTATAAEPLADALAFYNAAGVDEAELLAGFDPGEWRPYRSRTRAIWGYGGVDQSLGQAVALDDILAHQLFESSMVDQR